MKAPGARETLNWGLVALIGMGIYFVGGKMFGWSLPFTGGGTSPGGTSPGLENYGDAYTQQMNQLRNQVDAETKAAVETRQQWLDYHSYEEQQGIFYYHPEYQQAVDSYIKELDEYIDALSLYNGESIEQYNKVWAEFRDTQDNYAKFEALRQGLTA